MPLGPTGQDVRRLFLYSLSCALLHGLLQQHYYGVCKSSWLALFSLDPGPYCVLVRKSLSVLQWSPLVASGLWVPRLGQQQQHE